MIKSSLYLSALSGAAWTVRLRYEVNQHLVLMSTKSAQAAVLQSQAIEAQTAADEFMVQSEADEASSIELKEESMALLRESEMDAAKAVSLEAEGAEISQSSITEQSESIEELAQAAAADVVFKDEMATGVEMSDLSMESSAEATVDESAIALCQMIPFLDIVCDFVGGVAATALELSAAGEASEAAVSFAAAAVAKEEEESHASLAAELEAEAAAQMAEANELKELGIALEEKAQSEQVEAEELSAASKEEEAKSLSEKGSAEEEEVLATEDEAESQRLAESSLSHGVQAVWSLLKQTVCSIFIMGFLLVRLTFGFLVPSIVGASSAPIPTPTNQSTFVADLAVGTSFIFLSLSIWFSVALTYETILNIPNIKIRGGTILKISLSALVCQFLLLYAPTYWIHKVENSSNRFQSTFIFLVDLILVLAWNLFLCFPLSDMVEEIPTQAIYIVGPLVLVGTVVLHYIEFSRQKAKAQQFEIVLPAHSSEHNTANETTHLVKPKERLRHTMSQTSNRGWIQTHHRLLFEILLTTTVASLLRSCLVRAQILKPCWPIAREDFSGYLADHRDPLRSMICALALVIVAFVLAKRSLTHHQ